MTEALSPKTCFLRQPDQSPKKVAEILDYMEELFADFDPEIPIEQHVRSGRLKLGHKAGVYRLTEKAVRDK